jgi:tetratricopeptide (TPR) repeat protein
MKKEKHKPSPKKKEIVPVIEKKLVVRLAFIIALVSVLLYANTLHHGYVLDDASIIKDNTMTKGGTSSLKDIFTSSYRAGQANAENDLYRPMSKALFAIEWEIAPDNSTLAHFINIVLYGIACVLMFLVFSRWTRINIYILFITTLLFAAHPIHTEVVANIKSADEILTMIFLMLSLNSAMKYLTEKKMPHLILFPVYFFFALLSKESAIVFVAIIPLFIYFFTEFPAKKNIQVTAIAAVVAVISLIIHKSVTGQIGIPIIPVIDNSLLYTDNTSLQKATAIMILGRYLLLLIFPHPLSCDYSFNTIPIVSGFGDPGFLFSLAIHLFLLIYAIKKLKEKHILSFCILFYLISMSIASNVFILIGTHMAERLLFFPSIAFCLGVSYLLCKLFKIDFENIIPTFSAFFKTAKSYVILTVVVILLFSIKTMARNKDWKSNSDLFAKDIETVPNSAHMLMYYTGDIIKKEKLDKMSPEAKQATLLKAKSLIEKALKIYELFPDAHYLRGRVLYDLKDFNEAHKEYARAAYLNPSKAMYHNNAGTALFGLGKFGEAAKEFETAMKLNPEDPDPPFNLGSAFGAMGENLRAQNKPEEARKMFLQANVYFEKAIKMKPDYKSAYKFMGATYYSLGDPVKGKEYSDKAALIIEKTE